MVLDLTFIAPCISNIFAEYNQQDTNLINLFISVRRCTCFRRFFRPSSGVQNCTDSVRYLSDQCMCSFELLMMGGKNCLKHLERLTEINKLIKFASFWLHSEKRKTLTLVQILHFVQTEERITKIYSSMRIMIL